VLDPGHAAKRNVLRGIGVVLVVIGGLLTAAGLADFFSSFNSAGAFPTRFWMAFIGLPILGWGLRICKFAFLGDISRYTAGEVAPVARDTIDYLGFGGEGITCPRCHRANGARAHFCEDCGAPLDVRCPRCGHQSDAGAHFCEECGAPIALPAT
jgi:double zinc ribbon protein